MSFFSAARMTVTICVLGLLGACTAKDDLSEPPMPMGNFKLGHNIIVADKAQKGPLSRDASEDEWEAALKSAMATRFGRYEGDNFFHIGTHVDAYVLAIPGIPLVAAPKSILIITINVWDDATRQKLTAEPKQLTVFEHSEKNTFILGSGLTNSKAVQIQNLSNNAARMIQRYLLKSPQWFGLPPLKIRPDDGKTTIGSNK
ncbi:hypothetical protein [Profundibacter sp.]